MSKKTKTPIPNPTSWVDVVPGAEPPSGCLLVLLQELEDNTYNVFIGIWDTELKVFLNTEGSAVETMGKVTKYHILLSPAHNRFMVYYDDE